MDTTAIPAPLPATDTAGLDLASRAARVLHKLEQLSDIGIDLALLVQSRLHRSAAQEAPPAEIASLNQTYTRLARAIRQTLALESRLTEDFRTRDQRDRTETARRTAATGRRQRLGRKEQVRALVESSIEADKGIQDKEYLLQDLHEYLFDTDIDFADATIPLGDIVTAICHDLGVAPDSRSWPDEILGFVYVPDPPQAADAPPEPATG